MNYLDMQSIKAKILTDHYHKNHKNQNQYNVIFILNLFTMMWLNTLLPNIIIKPPNTITYHFWQEFLQLMLLYFYNIPLYSILCPWLPEIIHNLSTKGVFSFNPPPLRNSSLKTSILPFKNFGFETPIPSKWHWVGMDNF